MDQPNGKRIFFTNVFPFSFRKFFFSFKRKDHWACLSNFRYCFNSKSVTNLNLQFESKRGKKRDRGLAVLNMIAWVMMEVFQVMAALVRKETVLTGPENEEMELKKDPSWYSLGWGSLWPWSGKVRSYTHLLCYGPAQLKL